MKEQIYIMIGKNIKKIREEKGYSIKDLSRLTNLDTEYLSKIEQQGVDEKITFETLNTIATTLDINITYLFTNEKEDYSSFF